MKKNNTQPPKKIITIDSPSVLCFYRPEAKEETLIFFNRIESYPKTNKHFITLDLSNLVTITAAAATYLFTLVTAIQVYISHNYFSIKNPKQKESNKRYFNSTLHIALKSGGLSKLKKLWGEESSFICGNNSDVNKFLGLLRKRIGINNLPSKLTTAIKESLLNIHHHAYGGPTNLIDVTWWCYFYTNEDEKGKYLITVITDRGAGIPNPLKRAFPLITKFDDSDCIKYAMKESITSTGEKGRGKGSINIKKPIVSNLLTSDDILLILSDKGSYMCKVEDNKETEILNEYKDKIKGTLVEWRLYY